MTYNKNNVNVFRVESVSERKKQKQAKIARAMERESASTK